MKGWTPEIAQLWKKTVGPIRPSVSELNIYTKYAHDLLNKLNRKLDILILGSTPELRDWAYEENMNVTVIDCSKEFNKEVSKQIRHKLILEYPERYETLVINKWEDMNFENKFDIVIGDLPIGNIKPLDLEKFIFNIFRALRREGLFLGKQFLYNEKNNDFDMEEFCSKYYVSYTESHPFSYFIYEVAISAMDNNMLDFKKLYQELKKLNDKSYIDDKTMQYFESLHFDKEWNFKFYIPNKVDFENCISKYMNIENIEYGLDIYSKNFPLYIIRK